MSGKNSGGAEGYGKAARPSPEEAPQARGGIRFKSFNAWKSYAMSYLISISSRGLPQNVSLFIDSLIHKLKYARSRDLPRILSDLHLLSKEVPEAKNIIPLASEVMVWVSEE